jgi:hypothetical protein
LSGAVEQLVGSHADIDLSLFPGFVAFDSIKALLQDENGKISGPKTVVAGFGAGFTESLLAVTPFESIKTQLSVLPGRGMVIERLTMYGILQD